MKIKIRQKLGLVMATWLLLLALPTAVRAQFMFTTNNGAITITRYTGSGGMVVIPATTNGYPITSIGDRAFQSKPNIGSVTIPNSITNVGNYAFQGCVNLTNMQFGTNVIVIGQDAFATCGHLASVTIPNSVTNLGAGAFNGCVQLMAINVNPGSSFYSSVGGLLFDKTQNTLIQFPEGLSGSYTIPDSVTDIGQGAFQACQHVSSVIIGVNVTNIEQNAFNVCIGLAGVTLDTNLISIGAGAFAYCTRLTSVAIPDSVTSIGASAFDDCYGLTNALIGAGVTNIGLQAFDATPLTAILVASNNPAFSSLDGVLFNKTQTLLIQYPGGKAGSYTVPESVNSLGIEAFNDTPGLTSLMIPNTVTNIESRAFAVCSNLTSVFFEGNVPTPDNDSSVFAGDTSPTVYYLPGTTGWGSTFDNVPAILWNPQAQTGNGHLGVQTNQFGFNITGTTNIPLVVEASTNLGGAWVPLQSVSLTNGSFYFSDPQWTNYPGRFYRIRSP